MTDQRGQCYHCQLPLGQQQVPGFLPNGDAVAFCCAGCQAAAESIYAAGLDDFYQWRANPRPIRTLTTQERQQIEQLDNAQVQARFIVESADECSATLQVEGITCAACVSLIERHLLQQEGVISAQVNQSTQRLRLAWRSGASLSALAQRMAELGYLLKPYVASLAQQEQDREQRQFMLRLIAAGVGSMQVMMNAIVLYTGNIDPTTELIVRWASLILTLPVISYAAWPFYVHAWNDVRHGRLGMDVPVAIAILLTFAASVIATLTHSGEVYFESLCMFTFFLLLGRFLEFRSRRALADSGNALDDLIPAFVHVEQADGSVQPTAVNELKPGQRVHLLPGECLPVDGRLCSLQAEVDESSTTGEHRPRALIKGDKLLAGSINLGQPMVLEVTHRVGDSALSTLQRLLARAQAEKPRLIQITDRLAQQFVALILLLAAVSYTAWLFIDADRAFWIAISVLVVTCPCALSLAAPTVLTVANDRLRRAGFLITRGHVLTTLSRVDQIWFDKTGTLTEGKYSLGEQQVHPAAPALSTALSVAAALERPSEHPIASAFTDIAPAWHDWQHWAWLPNEGVTGERSGHHYQLSTYLPADDSLANKQAAEPVIPQQWIRLHVDQTPWLDMQLVDAVRADAAVALTELEQLGVRPGVLSGDPSPHVAWVARQVGSAVPEMTVLNGATADTKLALLQSMQADNHVVAMVGDGLNDAAALGGADVSVAMATGTDWSKQQADALILNGRLETLPLAVRVARRAAQITRQNVQWATVYNVVAIPLAGMGWVTPWMAAIGMSASSLIVVLNALRVRRIA